MVAKFIRKFISSTCTAIYKVHNSESDATFAALALAFLWFA